MSIDSQLEARVRLAGAALTDSTPQGRDFEELTARAIGQAATKRTSGLIAFSASFAAVVLIGGLIAWSSGVGPFGGDSVDVGHHDELPPVEDLGLGDDAPKLDEDTSRSVSELMPEKPDLREFSYEHPPTFEEYERVVFWTMECVEALGGTVAFFGLDSDIPDIGKAMPGISSSRIYVWAIPEQPRPPEWSPFSHNESIVLLCQSILYEEVAWYYHHSPTHEELDAWYESVRSCLIEAGVRIADDLTGESVYETLAAEMYRNDCVP